MIKKIFFCAFWVFAQSFLSFGQIKIMFQTGKISSVKSAPAQLFLAGNFNDWNPADSAWQMLPNGNKGYQLLKKLPKGIYNYKITRGSWDKVECTVQGKSIDNRTLTLVNDTTVSLNVAAWQDSFPPVQKQHTASVQVHIINNKFDMPQLSRQRRIWIYLPVEYASAKNKYPVIYMHDGQNLFDGYDNSEWGIDELLDKMPAGKQCIVVGIDHGGNERISEYDPWDSKYAKGRGIDYVAFLVKTLKPYIDANYKTKPQAKYTTIAGSSMGGLVSMYAALKHPAVFGNAGIFSPAFWIAPQIYELARQTNVSKKSRFYFICGDAESDLMVSDMKRMAAILRAKGIKIQHAPVVVIKGASHNEKQWQGDFPGFYTWLVK